MILGRFRSLQKEPGKLIGPGDLPVKQQQNRDLSPGRCCMCTRPSAHIQAHNLALHPMPGTAAESGLRVKSCVARLSTDFMPIQPTQVYRKGDQISAVSSSLWTLSLSIPPGKSALLFRVSSCSSADSVSPLICTLFRLPCKKNKMVFYPLEVPVLSLAGFLIFTVLYLFLLSAKWC